MNTAITTVSYESDGVEYSREVFTSFPDQAIFINLKAKELKIASIPSIAPGAIEPMMSYRWPGNVRELQNVIERALILNPQGPLTFENLGTKRQKPADPTEVPSLQSYNLDEMIAQHINRVLRISKGRINGRDGAAELLGINPSTLRNRMKRLGINYGRKA